MRAASSSPRNSPSAAATARRTRGCLSSAAATSAARASSRRVWPSARAAAARTPQKSSPRSAVASAAMPAGSGSWPRARAAATRSIASRAAASCRRHSAAFFSSRIDFNTTSPGSKITCVGRAGRRSSNACVASETLTRSSCSRPSISKRTAAENLNGGASGVIGCFCAIRSVPSLRSSSHSQRPSSSGWPGPRDPAVQQLVDVAPGRLLDGAREIPRLHRSVRVFAGVVRDRAPERGVTQLVAQHVDDAAAFFVQVGVEQVDRLVVLPADDRPLVAPGLVQVAVGVDEQLQVGLVAPLGVFAPDIFEVGREPLVQPRLGPLAAGEQVAPPLVGELVRHQAFHVVIDRGALVEQHQVGQRRRGGVLHAAEDEFGHRDLAVARVGVRHADALGEEVDHLGRPPEAAAGVVLAPGRDEVEDVDARARRAVRDLDERSRHQRHQVGGLREVERVVPADAAVGQLGPLAQRAVRQHEVAGWRRADHLGRELLDRVIDAGPVVARIVVLALRPALHRARRVFGVGADEVEAAPRLAGVADRDVQLRAVGGRLGADDAQLLAVVVEVGRRGRRR